MEPTGQQNHTYGGSLWIPFTGTGIGEDANPYVLRSQFAPSNTACWDSANPALDYAAITKLLGERLATAPLRMGDFYPLTPFAGGNDATMAWQFDRPVQGDGMVQAFRRPDSNQDSLTLKLHGLDRDATYVLQNLDEKSETRQSGAVLIDRGIDVALREKPAAVIVTYRRAPSPR